MPEPRPDSAPDPGAEHTIALGARPATGSGADVGVGTGPDAGETTVRLPREAEAGAEDEEEAANATFLDPRVWRSTPPSGETITLTDPARAGESTTPAEVQDAEAEPAVSAAPQERPLAPGELRRFGPGVPPRAAAAWHGRATPEAGPPRRARRVWRWLAPLVVALLALAAFLFWRHLRGPALAVTGVTVTVDPASPGCAGTAVATAVVESNGGSGALRYRWLRSDGTASDEIVQDVRSGAHRTDLVLRWSFEGQGSLQATATLELLTPTPRTAAASFSYHCP
ncbi:MULTISPECIES: hypothetical protein [unclassified Kitasatospora]|uniref:hypothetical protein n=1 Tax=unclassified Kitasatospora TaxID=2633591 RepID=UPI00340148DB